MRFLIFLPLFLSGCGSVALQSFPSLSELQPRVVSILPSDQASEFQGKSIALEFDRPIDPVTVTPATFVVTEIKEKSLEETIQKAQAGDLVSLAGEIRVEEEGKKIQFVAENDFSPNQTVAVIATTRILSSERLPLNQTPGEGPTPFWSCFTTSGGGEASEAASIDGLVVASNVSRPERLVLNEILYDVEGTDTEGKLFIELLGDPESNLSGYSVFISRANDGAIQTVLTIPAGFTIGADSFFVIADAVTGESAVTNVVGADWVKNFDSPNAAGCIQLVDPDGNLVDALGYGTPVALRGENNLFCFETKPTADVETGISLSRTEGNDTDDNSADWMGNETPSPGGF
ncbi:MAG: Ig-like domain-containing protein [Deltaproteobacteria bacterium]|nr:Ig-like domain-containing protein [Deltaproteobacteria bacterium]